MMQAVLSNASHPEYRVATIPFPIPREQFDHCIELVEALEIGNASARDCHVDEIRSAWPVLTRLEGRTVNLDELDYLAKRLDSFDVGEAAQFQAMAEKLDLTDTKDLINLTFCCQETTVITDFSDLEAVGRDHYMNTHGGCASVQELEDLDAEETALLLIDGGGGTVTRYGVVYDNGMKLEQSYDGKHFPAYLYEPPMLMVALTSRLEPVDTKDITWLYLPAAKGQSEPWPAPALQTRRICASGLRRVCSPMKWMWRWISSTKASTSSTSWHRPWASSLWMTAKSWALWS